MDYYAGMEIQASKVLQKDLTTLKDNVKAMNTENERLRIASDNPHTFQFTGKFVFINHSDDEVRSLTLPLRPFFHCSRFARVCGANVFQPLL